MPHPHEAHRTLMNPALRVPVPRQHAPISPLVVHGNPSCPNPHIRYDKYPIAPSLQTVAAQHAIMTRMPLQGERSELRSASLWGRTRRAISSLPRLRTSSGSLPTLSTWSGKDAGGEGSPAAIPPELARNISRL